MGELLIADMLELWPGVKFVPSDEICAALIEYRPNAWGDVNHRGRALNPQRIGRVLGVDRGIRSVKNHTGKRGYCMDYIEWRTREGQQ